MDHLLFAVLYLIELGSLVYIFHSVAQHAADELGEFGGHGLGRHRRPQLCSWRVASLPFNASNTRAVSSSLAVATNRPSGLKATAQTPLLCPGRRTPRQLPQDPSLHSFHQNSIRHVGQCSSRPSALSNRHRTYTRTASSTPHQAPPNPIQAEQHYLTQSVKLFLRRSLVCTTVSSNE